MYESRQGSVASNDALLFCTFCEHLQLAKNPTTHPVLKEGSAKTAIYHVNQAHSTVLIFIKCAAQARSTLSAILSI